jgi:hypothetical protein
MDIVELGISILGYVYILYTYNIAALGFFLASSLYVFDKKGSIILDFINPEEPTESELLLLRRYRKKSQESSSSSSEEGDSSDTMGNSIVSVGYEESKESLTPPPLLMSYILNEEETPTLDKRPSSKAKVHLE